MFNNIGRTIKILAKIIWWIGTITIVGIILFWPTAFVCYGFGELIEKACEIADNTRSVKYNSAAGNANIRSQVQKQSDYERINKLERLRAQGLISEDEYKQAVAKEQ
ncbi:MAG: SHOCT domain-containing protein [Clostridia bacterium]|nr:SHOCT domain-containing protein [Clostridia bacterium]